MTADAVGGVWTYVMDLCAALAQYEVEVVLATMGPRPSALQRQHASKLKNVHLTISDYRLEWMADSTADVRRAGQWLRSLAIGAAVDLVHVNGFAHADLQWRQPVILVAHSCVGTWWQAVHGVPAPAEWACYRSNVLAGLAAADSVVAPTRAFLTQLRELYGRLPAARVIYNGRSPPQLAAAPPSSRLPVVFACGRLWDESKRLRSLTAVAQDLPWPVLIAGEAQAPDGYRAVSMVGVHTFGALPPFEVRDWMRKSSIFVHPACYEPFGLVVLEAALAGCALVLADLPSLRELWSGAALFVDAANARQVRDAIQLLIQDPVRRLGIARAAQVRAAQFSAASMALDYMNLYQELLTRQRRRHLARKQVNQ